MSEGDRSYQHGPGTLLREAGLVPDPGVVLQRGENDIVFHYTRAEGVKSILSAGLRNFRSADWASLVSSSAVPYIAKAFLETVPGWLHWSPYFGDLGWSLMRRYIVGAAHERRSRYERVAEASVLALDPVGGLWDEGDLHITGWHGSPSETDVASARLLVEQLLDVINPSASKA
jgi:hypothetical protein